MSSNGDGDKCKGLVSREHEPERSTTRVANQVSRIAPEAERGRSAADIVSTDTWRVFKVVVLL